jgi:hypothetical protein
MHRGTAAAATRLSSLSTPCPARHQDARPTLPPSVALLAQVGWFAAASPLIVQLRMGRRCRVNSHGSPVVSASCCGDADTHRSHAPAENADQRSDGLRSATSIEAIEELRKIVGGYIGTVHGFTSIDIYGDGLAMPCVALSI